MPTAVTRRRHFNNITILLVKRVKPHHVYIEQPEIFKTRASTEHCDRNTQKERTQVLDLEARDLHCATRALWRIRT